MEPSRFAKQDRKKTGWAHLYGICENGERVMFQQNKQNRVKEKIATAQIQPSPCQLEITLGEDDYGEAKQ